MNSAQTVLTIEDDDAIRQGIVDALQFAGFRVIQTARGDSGLDLAITAEYDLLLLDLALPGVPGIEILKRLRQSLPTRPVIVLTAKGEETDRVRGLQLGADDYVVKPFSVKELLARIHAVLRRTPDRPSDIMQIEFSGGVADFARRELRFEPADQVSIQRVELSEREAELLRYLVSHRGRAISRDELLSNVWRLSPQGISTRTIDMHIARLREKMRDSSSEPQVLLTVRGKGYMFQNNSNTPS